MKHGWNTEREGGQSQVLAELPPSLAGLLRRTGALPGPTDGHHTDGKRNEHGTEGPKMGLSGSFALPVLRTVTMRGSCRAVTLPCLIRVSSVARGDPFWFIQSLTAGVEALKPSRTKLD